MKKYISILALTLSMHTALSSPTKKAIIFDVSGVLIGEDTMQFASRIGLGAITKYTLSHWRNPIEVCLDTLQKISRQEKNQASVPYTLKGRTMPTCITDWQKGTKTYNQTHKELHAHLTRLAKNNYFSSAQEKELMQRIITVALDPAHLPAVTKRVESMIKIVRELKDNGHQLYAISNMPHEAHAIMQTQYQDLFALFDGTVFSANVHMVKPDKNIYKALLAQHQLEPHSCVFVDNDKHDVRMAQKLGIDGIHSTSAKKLRRELRKKGLL